jgi:hypothetical protein
MISFLGASDAVQTIPLQALPKQSFTIVLDGVLYELALKETAGVMSFDCTRAGVVICSGARVVAGALMLNYRPQEDGNGNFMILTNDGDLPWWEEFGNSQVMLYASNADLLAVRNGN